MFPGTVLINKDQEESKDESHWPLGYRLVPALRRHKDEENLSWEKCYVPMFHQRMGRKNLSRGEADGYCAIATLPRKCKKW